MPNVKTKVSLKYLKSATCIINTNDRRGLLLTIKLNHVQIPIIKTNIILIITFSIFWSMCRALS